MMGMTEYLRRKHGICDIKYHVVWITKCRYKVLTGDLAVRARGLLTQICAEREITIVQGSVGKGHVHMLISCPTSLAPSKIIQHLKGTSSRILHQEFKHLVKRYWGQHLWARGYFCATVESVTKQMIQDYF